MGQTVTRSDRRDGKKRASQNIREPSVSRELMEVYYRIRIGQQRFGKSLPPGIAVNSRRFLLGMSVLSEAANQCSFDEFRDMYVHQLLPTIKFSIKNRRLMRDAIGEVARYVRSEGSPCLSSFLLGQRQR